ncbi:MAG TPA: DUF3084 domain-containing protein [Trueperaceae bacterium]|nr:DUF3084 domain-containing protein [Trueperaceae bacterium]
MTFIVLLVVALVVLAGIIAFAGDRLGTYVGRRRLSLFGARPRRTGQIVGVAAGIVIMLTTLTVLAFAFQNATDTLINFQRTLEELNQLRVQQRVLDERVNDANEQLTEVRAELEVAQETIRTAEAQRDAAISARDAALSERESLLQQRDDLQLKVDQAVAEVSSAEQQLEAVTAELTQTEEQLNSATADLEQTRSEREAALEEAEVAQAEAGRLQQDVTAARADLAEADDQLGALQSELGGLQAELVEAALDLAKAEQGIQTAQAEISQAEADLAAAAAAQAAAEASRQEALAQRDTALAERDDAQQESASLTTRLEGLNREVADLEAVAEQLRNQAAGLQQQNDALMASNANLNLENERLQQQSASLDALNDSLEAEIRRRNEDLLELQAEVGDLRAEVENQARQLAELQQEAGRFEGGEVYFVRDQLIYSGAVFAQSAAEAREELAAFIAEATTFVSRRGVERIRVTTEQFNLLVDVITQTPGSDLIRLISPSNQISSTIDVLVEAIENTVLFERGQLVVSSHLHLGTSDLPISQDEIRNSLANLKTEAVRKMRRAGLDEGQLPDFGPVTEETFTNMLLRLTGPVSIGLVATEPISRAGPARLELMILY